MKRTPLMWMLAGLVLVLAVSCNTTKIDPMAEKTAVEKVIYKSIGWALDKDIQGLYQVMAQDENLLIINPDSASGGHHGFGPFKAFAEQVFMDPRFQAKSMEIRDLQITLSQSGTVAWFFCTLDDIAEWDGQPSCWYNIRWSGVVEKRDGHWVHTQQHFSFPTDRFKKR